MAGQVTPGEGAIRSPIDVPEDDDDDGLGRTCCRVRSAAGSHRSAVSPAAEPHEPPRMAAAPRRRCPELTSQQARPGAGQDAPRRRSHCLERWTASMTSPDPRSPIRSGTCIAGGTGRTGARSQRSTCPSRQRRASPFPAAAQLHSLARLGIGLTRCRRQRQGDDIDIDATVEARVDTLAGSPQDDDFYIASLRRRRDLAVLVLLDVSGSASEPGTGGKTVHQHQRSVAATLTAALDALGDRVAIYAFEFPGPAGRCTCFGSRHRRSPRRRRGPTSVRARSRCVHAPGRRHPPWHVDPRRARGDLPAAAGRTLRRLGLRPRLRGSLRRGRSAASADRSSP